MDVGVIKFILLKAIGEGFRGQSVKREMKAGFDNKDTGNDEENRKIHARQLCHQFIILGGAGPVD